MNTKSDIIPGKKYRFIAKSAEEAVKIIQDAMGPKAKVLSVNQLGEQGLSKFLSSPKLEIIACIPEEQEEAPKVESSKVIIDDEPKEIEKQSVPSTESAYGYNVNNKIKAKPQTKSSASPSSSPINLFLKLGFSEVFLSAFLNHVSQSNLEQMNHSQALAQFGLWLRREFDNIPKRKLTNRIAFIGSPGCGKTTALCRQLTNEVFLEQSKPRVVKLDTDTPNSADALLTFSEVLGLRFTREPFGIKDFDDHDRYYFDCPGISFQSKRETEALSTRLNELEVDTRVLVVNSAYDADIVKEQISLGNRIGVTHLILSHIDEVKYPAKLWQSILRSGFSPLYFVASQSVTEVSRTSIFDELFQKTFPGAHAG